MNKKLSLDMAESKENVNPFVVVHSDQIEMLNSKLSKINLEPHGGDVAQARARDDGEGDTAMAVDVPPQSPRRDYAHAIRPSSTLSPDSQTKLLRRTRKCFWRLNEIGGFDATPVEPAAAAPRTSAKRQRVRHPAGNWAYPLPPSPKRQKSYHDHDVDKYFEMLEMAEDPSDV